jgi:hypothetical protein
MFDLDKLALTERDGTPLREGLHALFGPVSGADAAAGSTEDRLLYLVNSDPSPVGVMNAALTVEGSDQVRACLDRRGRPGKRPPADAAWAETVRLPRLRPGERIALWLRRTVDPGSPMQELVPLSLALECDVI